VLLTAAAIQKHSRQMTTKLPSMSRTLLRNACCASSAVFTVVDGDAAPPGVACPVKVCCSIQSRAEKQKTKRGYVSSSQQYYRSSLHAYALFANEPVQ
jgi:hypothetical protein